MVSISLRSNIDAKNKYTINDLPSPVNNGDVVNLAYLESYVNSLPDGTYIPYTMSIGAVKYLSTYQYTVSYFYGRINGTANNLEISSSKTIDASDTGLRAINGMYQSNTLTGTIYISGRANATVTFNLGTNEVTLATHGLSTGCPIFFTTTGTLPTGITANTIYAIRSITAATFSLHPTVTDAINNTNQIDLSGAPTGTHTGNFNCVIGDGTTFSSNYIVGDVIKSESTAQYRKVTSVDSNTQLKVDSVWTTTLTNVNHRNGGRIANTFYYLYALKHNTTASSNGFILTTRNKKGGDSFLPLPSELSSNYSWDNYVQLPFCIKTAVASTDLVRYNFDSQTYEISYEKPAEAEMYSGGYPTATYADVTGFNNYVPTRAERVKIKVDRLHHPAVYGGEMWLRDKNNTNAELYYPMVSQYSSDTYTSELYLYSNSTTNTMIQVKSGTYSYMLYMSVLSFKI